MSDTLQLVVSLPPLKLNETRQLSAQPLRSLRLRGFARGVSDTHEARNLGCHLAQVNCVKRILQQYRGDAKNAEVAQRADEFH